MTDNLSDLFRTARQYGLVRIHTLDDGKYYCCIVFNTMKHTQLEAKSDFNQLTPEDAVKMAIKTAQSIIDSINKMSETLPQRKLLS